ncbi:PTS sugar transporter subunit IIB [Anaerostipes sp.]|uniref:PTS sugar transporter subunit IIB n=1 Tax=Anaerostipes sp. TaxID=1872530 RepID=UPI0025C3A265|nr:PTS sugar transporter subunit IIB [Anaerostipes sp.]MBS7009120.1 PTS sugar transporter subunit IIB [Anaerostipes sp.]
MADIKAARIDFRLIHGQVITKWIKYYPVDMIVIVDDALKNDDFMVEIYKMAVPKGVKFKVVSQEEAAEVLNTIDASVFLLFKNVETCIRAVQDGVCFDFLVVGGVPGEGGRKFISDGIYLSPGEFKMLEEINQTVPEIIFKSIPEETAVPMEKAKEKIR